MGTPPEAGCGHHDHAHGAHHHHHHHGHAHGHHHGLPSSHASRRIGLAFFLIAIVLVVELSVAILSRSLALLADAGHVLTDLFALGLSWFALRQAERPSDASRTYGYHRTGILVALVNASTLIIIAFYIAHEAWERLFSPVQVEGGLMMFAAFVGLVVNLYVGWDLSREETDNLNVRSAVLHVFGDAMASLGVIIAAALLWWQPGWAWIDPAIAVAIALMIGVGAWQIVRDATGVLMEEAPRNIDMDALVRRIQETPGVDGVHHLHVWSLAAGYPVLTCHLLLSELDVVSTAAVMNAVKELLRDEFGIDHCTLQPEWELCGPDNLYCTPDMLRSHQPVSAPGPSRAPSPDQE